MTISPTEITMSMDAKDYADLHRLRAMERYVASVFDYWVNGVADLMALYDGLTWDEVVPMAVEEIKAARS